MHPGHGGGVASWSFGNDGSGTGFDGLVDEVMTVNGLAPQGDESEAWLHFAGVIGDAGDLGVEITIDHGAGERGCDFAQFHLRSPGGTKLIFIERSGATARWSRVLFTTSANTGAASLPP